MLSSMFFTIVCAVGLAHVAGKQTALRASKGQLALPPPGTPNVANLPPLMTATTALKTSLGDPKKQDATGQCLYDLLTEIETYVAPKILHVETVPTSGTCIQRFAAGGDHHFLGFTINAQIGESDPTLKLANFLHEATHCRTRVYGSYEINFHVTSTKAVVAPAITAHSVVSNGEAVDGCYMHGDAAFILSQNMLGLGDLVDKPHTLPAAQQAYLKTKAVYAQGKSATEHDACLTSMLVACANWGCKTKHANVHKMLGTMCKEASGRRNSGGTARSTAPVSAGTAIASMPKCLNTKTKCK